MNLLRVSWRNLWHRPFSTAVSVLLMLLGVSMVSLVLHISSQLQGQFTKNIAGIDMVIGAKGSPKQLILSSVYHIDAPTGNILKSEVDDILKHPMIKTAIPLAYGDSYKGFKIVGTTKDYLSHFNAEIAEGEVFEESLEVVLGAKVAQRLGLKLGSYFHGTHGMEEADDEQVHAHHDYKVVGILKPTGLALDQLLICNVASVWDIHSEEHATTHEQEREYTAVLIKFSNPMGMMMIPRTVNEKTNMQAAMPSIEISSLIDQMGLGVETLRLLALLIIIISGISVFLSLLAALKERKYELAIMRSLGAHPLQLVFLVIYEALLISVVSAFLGLLLSRFMLIYLGTYLDQNFHYNFDSIGILNEEYLLIGLALLIGFVAALVPSFMAFKVNISKTLSQD
ncbi:MAG: ABC transporter permease [Bacteroidia bacterium]